MAWELSENRRSGSPGQLARVVVTGLLAQIVLAVVLPGLPQSRLAFDALGSARADHALPLPSAAL